MQSENQSINQIISKINQLSDTNIISSQRVEKGFLTENFILSDGKNRYFLKKYRSNNPERINEIHVVKKYFADGDIPVVLPVSQQDEKTFFEYDKAYYALFPFVESKHIERNEISDKAINSLGKMLGRIHLLGKESRLIVNDYFKVKDKEDVLKRIDEILFRISQTNTQNSFDRVAVDNLQLKRQLILKNSFTIDNLALKIDHLIHGDYHEQNIFFDNKDNVKWVFDFEKTNYSPRTFELFRSMVLLFLSDDVSEVDLNNARKYLKAYASIYPISDDEIRRGLQLYFVKIIHGIWVETEHYINGNTRVDQFLFNDFNKIKYLSENLDLFTNYML